MDKTSAAKPQQPAAADGLLAFITHDALHRGCVVLQAPDDAVAEAWLDAVLCPALQVRGRRLHRVDAARPGAAAQLAALRPTTPWSDKVMALTSLRQTLGAGLPDRHAAAVRTELLGALMRQDDPLLWVLVLDAEGLRLISHWQALVPTLLERVWVLPAAASAADTPPAPQHGQALRAGLPLLQGAGA